MSSKKEVKLEVSYTIAFVLILVSFIAGILNGITGGGGMILVPLMLVTGVPPINAIAINKFQNTLGSFSATVQYIRKGLLNLRDNKRVIIFSLIGSCLGVWLLQWFASKGALETFIPYALIFISIYSFIARKKTAKKTKPRLSSKAFDSMVGISTGLYGGFVGIGTGPFLVMAFSFLRGANIKTAIASSKPIMLIVNLSSMLLLLFAGHVWWIIGSFMGLGNIIGTYIGTNIVVSGGVKIIQILMILVPLGSAIKLLLF